MTWRFLSTGREHGTFNMALDEVLARTCAEGLSPPVLRVYGWRPWTLSLGRMQQAPRHVHLERCAADEIPVVRRPTGGRAVFHAEELTYSFAARFSDLPVAATVSEIYRFVAGALVEALGSWGIDAYIWPMERRDAMRRSFARAGDSRPAVQRTAGPGSANQTTTRRSPCFASVSQYEICVGGKKLVGSAQRKWPDVVLQHGSILLGPAHLRITDYLKGSKLGGLNKLAEQTTTLGEILGRTVPAEELAESVRRGAETAWGMDLMEDSVRPAEEKKAAQLVKSKYGTDDWKLFGEAQVSGVSRATPGDSL